MAANGNDAGILPISVLTAYGLFGAEVHERLQYAYKSQLLNNAQMPAGDSALEAQSLCPLVAETSRSSDMIATGCL